MLPPTLELKDGVLSLYPEALYWGTRALVVEVCGHRERVVDASGFIAQQRPAESPVASTQRVGSRPAVTSTVAAVTSGKPGESFTVGPPKRDAGTAKE